MSRIDHMRALLLAPVVGICAGLLAAFFLESLHFVTRIQTEHPWLLYLLPVCGAGIAWSYSRFGGNAGSGNNLLLEHLHRPEDVRIPVRMVPLILFTSIATHLFGGSAGREGTGIQMGGGVAAEISRRAHASPPLGRILVMCGIAGGFAGVFGTPIAGTIFAVELMAIGQLVWEALPAAAIAAVAADLSLHLVQVEHTPRYLPSDLPALSLLVGLKVLLAGVAFGACAALFIELTHTIEHGSRRLIASPILRTTVGGIAVILATLTLGTRIYNGLSLPLLDTAVAGSHVPMFAFLAKLGLTALTLGVGFKGGEVTPLFVIGATLGVTLAGPLGLPPATLAAIGFIAVFAAAANTPLSCIVLGAEMFGMDLIAFVAIAVCAAWFVSGHRGIYASQRVIRPKHAFVSHPGNPTLAELRQRRGT